MLIEILLALGASTGIPEVNCDIDEVVYQLKGAPQFTAGFEPQIRQTSYASELVFWFKTPKRIYWFAFNSPNGYGGTYIGPDVDPGRIRHMSEAERDADEDARRRVDLARETEALSLDFDAFRPDLTVYEAPPQRSDPAPARLFARGLGHALWYKPTELSGGDGMAEQEAMPIAMFEPARCGERGLGGTNIQPRPGARSKRGKIKRSKFE